jgi:DNA repair protein RadC
MENKLRNIKSWALEDRPREKMMQRGKESLTDAELLGILIGIGTRELSAVDLAKQILNSVNGDLSLLSKLSLKAITKFKGMGPAKAVTVMAALELARRKQEVEPQQKPILSHSSAAYKYLKPYLTGLQQEEFWIILLTRKSELIKHLQISIGGVTSTIADPKIIYKHALEHLASGIIVCHNHPSGNLNPSNADKMLTSKLQSAAELLDISFMDHIIFTDNGYYSFRDEGLLSCMK